MKCRDCKYADEYLCWWWYPYYDPTCLKGHSIPQTDCEDYVKLGRDCR